MCQTPPICFSAVRASRSRNVFAPLRVRSSASQVPERIWFVVATRADQAPRQPRGALRADQVPPMTAAPFSSIKDHVPSATLGVETATSAVQVPAKT